MVGQVSDGKKVDIFMLSNNLRASLISLRSEKHGFGSVQIMNRVGHSVDNESLDTVFPILAFHDYSVLIQTFFMYYQDINLPLGTRFADELNVPLHFHRSGAV